MEHLIPDIQKGDREAMQQLYRSTFRYLATVCQRYLEREEDVKDVLQESYLKIFEGLRDFTPQGEGSLRGWMTRIVVNESLQVLRHQSRWEWIESRDELPDVVDDSTLPTDGIPLADIYRLIRRLPAGYRTVFNLYVIEERSHREIGQLLGIGERTSASQLCRAKVLLRQWIEEYHRSLGHPVSPSSSSSNSSTPNPHKQ